MKKIRIENDFVLLIIWCSVEDKNTKSDLIPMLFLLVIPVFFFPVIPVRDTGIQYKSVCRSYNWSGILGVYIAGTGKVSPTSYRDSFTVSHIDPANTPRDDDVINLEALPSVSYIKNNVYDEIGWIPVSRTGMAGKKGTGMTRESCWNDALRTFVQFCVRYLDDNGRATLMKGKI